MTPKNRSTALQLALGTIGALAFAPLLASPLACGSRTTPALSATHGALVFGEKPVSPGATWVRRELTETSGTILVSGADAGGTLAGQRIHTIHLSERRIEALAVTSGLVSRARVLYVADTETTIDDDKTKHEKPTAIASKLYIVERKAAELLITDERGQQVPEEERELVAQDHRHFGEADTFSAAIPARPLVAGESLEPMARALRETSEHDGAEVKEAKVRFQEERAWFGERVGAFEYELVTTRKDDAGKTTISVKGVQVLRAGDRFDVEETANGESIAEHDLEVDGGAGGRSREVSRFVFHASTMPR